MSFIPNLPDAAHDPQAYPTATDIDILLAGIEGDGVVTGLGVTPASPEGMKVVVAAGTAVIDGVAYAHSGGTLTIGAAHATLWRRDLVTAGTAVVSVVQGTAGASNPTSGALAVLPALPASSVALASVEVPPAVTSITSSELLDKRVTVAAPSTVGDNQINTIAKSADETVNNSTTLQNDDHLFFAAQANTIYYFEMVLDLQAASSTPGWKFSWSLPSGATLAWVSQPQNNSNPATPSSAAPNLIGSTSEQLVVLAGWIRISSTGGTAQFQWAQSTANASDSTLKKGSLLRYEPVA